MNLDSAQRFVQKMREDTGFRITVSNLRNRAELWSYLKSRGFDFNACDLVRAMAVCMAESDRTS